MFVLVIDAKRFTPSAAANDPAEHKFKEEHCSVVKVLLNQILKFALNAPNLWSLNCQFLLSQIQIRTQEINFQAHRVGWPPKT